MPRFNPFNTARVYRHESSLKLLAVSGLYKIFSYNGVASTVTSMMTSSSLARYAAEITVLPQFCLRATADSIKSLAFGLKAKYSIRSIPDPISEEASTLADRKFNLKEKIQCIAFAAKINNKSKCKRQGNTVMFVPLKITSIVCPETLEKVTTVLNKLSDQSSDIDILETRLEKEYPDLMSDIEYDIQYVMKICRVAKKANISIVIDAEQSNRQPAIEFIGRQLARQMNTLGDTPTVYQTYQMYLVKNMDVIIREMEIAEKEGYVYAVSLVRGAYRTLERERERKYGIRILHRCKDNTDDAYDDMVMTLLERIANRGRISVILATHNTESVTRAVSTMERLGISTDHPGVHLAQLKGIADHLTVSLGEAGYNVHKQYAFGSFDDVMPFLIRRLNENKDVYGAMQLDRQLIATELQRRFSATENAQKEKYSYYGEQGWR
eukprot:CAMPEP_0182419562 /NCGR_PEP_ID=MMETSP1167-20130531/3987_1 /TAXON_ID=2988 /ORGANISM="Mallomonas Sp, Strain CCMP3275" /LENGTH=437 /DNA_ID=CAMNT_0024594547 /DNA_START=82 /DNA_END=1395 /DNA_ORIENTATION=+